MAGYSEYKDSGIPWIGKIPSHWDVKPIRSFLSQSKELNADENATLLTLSQYKGVNIRIGNEDSSISAAESLIGYNVVHKGQFVMNIMLAWNGSYGVSDYDGVISPAYAIFNFKDSVCKAFYHYLWRTKAYQDAFKSRSKGIVDSRLRLYPQYFLPFYTSIPPIEEQEAIVEYLDTVTADINNAIAAKERIIAALEERRKIIITHAVTRGVNTDVPMRDSGIDWLGEIPASWNICKVKTVAIISHGSDPVKNGDIPVYGSGANSFRTCGEYKEGPAVLLGRKGATLHIPHYIEGKYWNVDTAFDVKVDDQRFNLRYFYYLAMCFDYDRYKTQTTLPSMTQSSYANICIPFPPLEEQVKIVRYLDGENQRYNEVRSQQMNLIELLRERKNIIINETVTGKVKVI